MKDKRPVILVAILAVLGALAFVVGRAGTAPPVVTPYVGKRGASRADTEGLAVSLRREGDVRPLAPGTPVRPGDVLHFVVRAEGPRYLIVRMRDGAAAPVTIFPAGATRAALVQPAEALPVAPTIAPGVGKVVVTAVFAEHAFALDARGDDTEEIDLVMAKE
jgi:hypothetical protein